MAVRTPLTLALILKMEHEVEIRVEMVTRGFRGNGKINIGVHIRSLHPIVMVRIAYETLRLLFPLTS